MFWSTSDSYYWSNLEILLSFWYFVNPKVEAVEAMYDNLGQHGSGSLVKMMNVICRCCQKPAWTWWCTFSVEAEAEVNLASILILNIYSISWRGRNGFFLPKNMTRIWQSFSAWVTRWIIGCLMLITQRIHIYYSNGFFFFCILITFGCIDDTLASQKQKGIESSFPMAIWRIKIQGNIENYHSTIIMIL